jgi:hypothetical protein
VSSVVWLLERERWREGDLSRKVEMGVFSSWLLERERERRRFEQES